MLRRHFSVLLCLLCAAALGACAPGGQPEGVVRDFIRAVEKQDVEQALSRCHLSTLPAANQGRLRAILSEMSARMAENGGLEHMNTMSSKVQEADAARVQVKLVFHSGRESRDNFNLRRLDGAWKIILDDFVLIP